MSMLRRSFYGEQWASLMHRELLQWIDDLTEGESFDALPQEGECGPPPGDEDWVCIKPVSPSITNIHQEITEWDSSTPQHEFGLVESRQEADTSTLNASDVPDRTGDSEGGVSDVPDRTGGGEGEVSADDPNGAGGGEGEGSGVAGGDEEEVSGDLNDAVSGEPEERVVAAATAEQEAAVSPASPAQLTWVTLNSLKRRLTYDILPKV